MTRSEWNACCRFAVKVWLWLLVAWFLILTACFVYGKDNGQFDKWKSGDATQDLLMHQWFEGLRSDLGLCCSFADGEVIVVWPIRYNGTVYNIRCFMPGAGT